MTASDERAVGYRGYSEEEIADRRNSRLYEADIIGLARSVENNRWLATLDALTRERDAAMEREREAVGLLKECRSRLAYYHGRYSGAVRALHELAKVANPDENGVPDLIGLASVNEDYQQAVDSILGAFRDLREAKHAAAAKPAASECPTCGSDNGALSKWKDTESGRSRSTNWTGPEEGWTICPDAFHTPRKSRPAR